MVFMPVRGCKVFFVLYDSVNAVGIRHTLRPPLGGHNGVGTDRHSHARDSLPRVGPCVHVRARIGKNLVLVLCARVKVGF